MHDQAFQLRRLALRTGLLSAREQNGDGRLLVVSGSRPQCGTTTIALNLALALVQQGQRTVLVDADERRPELARYCSVSPRITLSEVITGEGTIHEAITRGPGGLQVVPGGRTPSSDSPLEAARLIAQLRSLTGHADAIVVDAGCSHGEATTQLFQEATLLLAVTAPDAASVMESYASLKSHVGNELPSGRVPELFVNQADSAEEAQDIFRRIDQSCRRFLGWGLDWAGYAAVDDAARQAREQNLPLLLANPDSMLSLACERLGQRWLERTTPRTTTRRAA